MDPSPVSDSGGEAFGVIAKTIRQVMDGEPVTVAPYLVMGGTDGEVLCRAVGECLSFPGGAAPEGRP